MGAAEKLENSRMRFTIEIDAEKFEAGLQQAYLKLRGRMTVPGFRKGKAPRKVIENMYGEGVFYEEAFEALYPDAYEAAVRDENVTPVDYPEIDIISIDRETGIKFTATADIYPEAKIGDYKSIEAEKTVYKVEDVDVDNALESERQQQARWIDTDRAAENGDRVVIDYSGSVDGKKFDGGTAEKYTLTLGSNMMVPGFEDQIVGMKSGEEKTIKVTFPEQYHEESLAGKEAEFEIKMHEVQYSELPELDDEFVRDVSDTFDTLEEYKADIRSRLEKEAEQRSENSLESAILDKIAALVEADIPASMIEKETDNLVERNRYSMMMYGLRFEDYLQMTGSTMEEFRESQKETALMNIKTRLALEAVRDAEGITVSHDEVHEQIEKTAADYSMSPEDYMKNDTNGQLHERAESELMYEKTMAALKGYCKVTEITAEEAAAKAVREQMDKEAEVAEENAPAEEPEAGAEESADKE